MCTVLLQPYVNSIAVKNISYDKYIFVYFYPRKLIRGGIAATNWQTVELQVFLSAEVTIRIASVSEVLRGK